MTRAFCLLALSSVACGCATVSPARRATWESEAAPAVTALQQARFEEATALSQQALAIDPDNSRAHAVAAVSGFRGAAHELVSTMVSLAASVMASAAMGGNFLSMDLFDGPFARADERLAEVDQHLVAAAKDPQFSLELCLACWEVDWNRNGEIDDSDRRLFEVELDADGQPLPDDDPRRRPTFRLDVADAHWLRAAVAFTRSGLQVARAYDWAALAPVLLGSRGWRGDELRIRLRDPQKMHRAGALIAQGLSESLACRQSALEETDDDREWLPNPRQKNHPLPLEVDDALYETWAAVVTDAQKLLANQQALSVSELAQLGRHQWKDPPQGYLMPGRLFSDPHDLVVPLERLSRADGQRRGELEQLLKLVFAQAYLNDATPSGLTSHLRRMKGEVNAGHDSLERKLRYLLWVN